MKRTRILYLMAGAAACAVGLVRHTRAVQRARADDQKYFEQQLATLEDEGGIVRG